MKFSTKSCKYEKLFFFSLIPFLMFAGCTQTSKESEENNKIENTLQSVSLLYDSIEIEPSDLLSMAKRLKKAIDSIGYPDSGYKLWLIQGDSIMDFRFMIEGSWPNQAIYDSIHNNKLYLNARNSEDAKIWNKLNTVSYHRFPLVK